MKKFIVEESGYYKIRTEIQLKKCNYHFIDEKYEQEQEKIYDACKQIVRDYLNGDLVKVVEEWKNL